jgi:hypothetical protein
MKAWKLWIVFPQMTPKSFRKQFENQIKFDGIHNLQY